MGKLKFLFIAFILVFPFAELGRIQLNSGIAFSLNDIFLFPLITIWIARKIRKKEKLSGYLAYPITLFIVTAILSLLVNLGNLNPISFFVSFLYLLRFASYILLCFIFREFDVGFKKKMSYVLLSVGLISVLIGYLQFFFYPYLGNLYYLGWDKHLYRMFGSFLDPNFAGIFYVLYFIFSLNFLELRLSRISLKSIIFIAISALSLIAVYLTYSRSALLMLFISLIAYIILKNNKKLIIVMIFFFFLFIFLSPKSFQTEGTNLLRTTSSEARLISAEVAIGIFREHPGLGVGFNAYRYAQNKKGLNNIYWEDTHSGAGTDNSFLFVAATTGIIGLATYIYFLFKILKLAKVNLRKNIYSASLFSITLGLIVSSMFVNSLFYVFILEWFIMLVAFTESN